MMKPALLGLLLCLAAATMVPHLDPIDAHVPLVYKVNLEDPPEVRWAPIVRDYSEPLHKFMAFVDLLPVPKTFYDGV
jgi:hypothetical protein